MTGEEKPQSLSFFEDALFAASTARIIHTLKSREFVELDFVKEQIRNSRPFVSAVVFSGGEPLMQKAIVPLTEFTKGLGLLVGIHTNGCYPEMAAELVKRKLVDKFFIDIKAPPKSSELYGKVVGWGKYEAVKKTPEEITAAVIETIEIAESCALEPELRTTVIRDLIGSEEEIASIASWISEHVKNREVIYVLQQGIPEHSLQENLRKTRVLEREELYELGINSKKIPEKCQNKDKRSWRRNYLNLCFFFFDPRKKILINLSFFRLSIYLFQFIFSIYLFFSISFFSFFKFSVDYFPIFLFNFSIISLLRFLHEKLILSSNEFEVYKSLIHPKGKRHR